MRFISLLVIYLFIHHSLDAQVWETSVSYGGLGNESLDAMAILDDGRIVTTGSFEQNVDWNGISMVSVGEEDVYCGISQSDGTLDIAFSLGGNLQDQLSGISTFEDKISLFGSYNINATFDTIELNTNLGTKGLFITQYNTLGEVQWAHSIEGNILSINGDITQDESGNIFATGYFFDTLIVQQDTLVAQSDEGDLFVLKWDINGQLIWSIQAGDTGIMRSTRIAVDSEGRIIIAGKFKGAATFGTTTIQTNTADSDLFVAQLNQDGDFIWGKKLGGVFEDDLGDITLDENDNIYLCGYFLGILSSTEGWQIQTSGINLDAYLIRLNPNGDLEWGHSMGLSNDDFALSMDYQNGKLAITGYFTGNTYWGFNGLQAQDAFDACIAIFDSNGNILNMLAISGSDFEIGTQIMYGPNGNIITAGNFNGSCILDGEFISNGNFDAYWAISDIQVSNSDTYDIQQEIIVYPNPTQGLIEWNIVHENASLFHADGRLLIRTNDTRMDLSHFPNATYFLQLGTQWIPVIKIQ